MFKNRSWPLKGYFTARGKSLIDGCARRVVVWKVRKMREKKRH